MNGQAGCDKCALRRILCCGGFSVVLVSNFAVGVTEFELAMAMRRLVTSSLRARSFCSSSKELGSGLQIAEPVLTHGEIGEVSGIPEEHLKRKVRQHCCLIF